MNRCEDCDERLFETNSEEDVRSSAYDNWWRICCGQRGKQGRNKIYE